MKKEYFEPTQESGAVLFKRNIGGELLLSVWRALVIELQQ
jgi:hypothetical protein